MKIRKEIIGILIIVLCLSAIVIAGTIQLPQTGQTTSYYPGDDGDIQAGVPWPDPRFTVNGDCVTDNLTGLMWAKNGNIPNGGLQWEAALDFANDLTLCGYSDWRLPNINELESLINSGETDSAAWLNGVGFINVQPGWGANWGSAYWTSTSSMNSDSWIVGVTDGFSYVYGPHGSMQYVWPVRATTTLPSQIHQTGQTTSYYPGDDGDLEMGVHWDSNRFNDNDDGTVTDNLTGLIWLKDANCIASQYSQFDNDTSFGYGAGDGRVTWYHALDFVARINDGIYPNCSGGNSDWRLPNRKELRSLIDYSSRSLYGGLPAGHPFVNVQPGFWPSFWTSTTCAYSINSVSGGDMGFNYFDCVGKSGLTRVWPVRGGQIMPRPTLISPVNGDPVNIKDIVFVWSSVPGAASYEILIDNNSGFVSPELKETGLTLTSRTITNHLPDNVYYWKVRAKYADGTFTLWSSVWQFTYQLPVWSEPVWVPLYRLYKGGTTKDHYYTTSPAERDNAVKNSGYKYERIEGYISDRKFNDPNCGYLFHLYNAALNVHFYTSDEAEKESRITAAGGFAYQGIMGFVYLQPFEWGTSLYRLYKAANTDYFYTISDFEREYAISPYGFANDGSMNDGNEHTIVGYISSIGISDPNSRLMFNTRDGYGTNTGNGNFSYSHEDISIPGINLPFVFSRVYNSLNRGTDGSLGYGWTHSLDARLYDDGKKVFVIWPDGHADYYVRAAGNMTIDNPAACENDGCYDTLYIETPLSVDIYTITKKDQTKFIFQIPEIIPPDPDKAPFYTAQLRTIVEKNGKSIALWYDLTTRNLTSITDTANRTITFTYFTDAEGHLGHIKSIAYPVNRAIQFGYDAYDNLVSVTDASGNATTFTYDIDHQMTGVLLPEGQSLSNVYENFKTKSQTIDQKTYNIAYTPTLTTFTNPASDNIRYALNNSQLQSVTDAMNYNIPLLYDEPNNPTLPKQVIDRNNNKSTYTYDSGSADSSKKVLNRGNVLSVSRFLNQTDSLTTLFTYDDMNNILTSTDARGSVTRFDYDVSKKNLIKITYPEGGVVNITYTSNGLAETVTDPNNRTTTYAYDSAGNVTRITDSLSNHVDYAYDGAGRMTSMTDPAGKQTVYTYDANDNLTRVTNAETTYATYTYDRNNRLTKITDNRGKETDYTYNNMNLLASETGPDSKTYQYTYDSLGNLSKVTDNDGNYTEYVYDANNRVTDIKYNGSVKVSFPEYDPNGNLKRIVNDGRATSFAYDALNRITSYMDGFGKAVYYSYDNLAGKRYITYPANKTVTYSYDRDIRLTTVTDWLNGATTYTYDAAGILRSILNPNGTKTDYAYDTANRLIGLSNKQANNNIISDYSFTLNAVGNPSQVSVNEPLAPVITPANISYTVDPANKITSAGATTFTHDSRGNLTGSSSGNVYNYDYADRLIQATIGGQTAQYIYDGFGNRISRTSGGVETRYVLDLNAGMSNVLAETDAGGTISNYYIYGLGLISKITSADQRYVYHYDSIGNTIAITDSSGNITEKYAYDEFGKATSDQVNSLNPFRYVGEYGVMEEGNGLLFMRARYYDVANGRFLNKDPLGFGGGDLNLYAYVGGNPVTGIDPSGLAEANKIINLINSIDNKLAEIRINIDSNCDGSRISIDGEVCIENKSSFSLVSDPEEAVISIAVPTAYKVSYDTVYDISGSSYNLKNIKQTIKKGAENAIDGGKKFLEGGKAFIEKASTQMNRFWYGTPTPIKR